MAATVNARDVYLAGQTRLNTIALPAGVTIDNTQVSGLGDLATQNSVAAANLDSTISAIEIVSTLPSAGNYAGRTVYLTTNGKIYRYYSGAWTAAVPTTDLAGTISNTQIADNSISTPKLQANAVTATIINANAVTTDKILASAITADKVATGAISAAKIAAGAVTADKITALAVTADKVAANAITAAKLQTGVAVVTETLQLGSEIVTVPRFNNTTSDVTTVGTLEIVTLAQVTFATGATPPSTMFVIAAVSFIPMAAPVGTPTNVILAIKRVNASGGTYTTVVEVNFSIYDNLYMGAVVPFGDTAALSANTTYIYNVTVRKASAGDPNVKITGSSIFVLGAKR